ncbi:MAG: alpha/beta fold hydrolase [Desulfobacterales bacterium]|nr:alpha/beta fold hydrolase [Desulfobacterales bacterium]
MTLTLIIAAIILFHLGWYLLSLHKTRPALPDEQAIVRFQKANESILHLESVRGLLEECYIEANGFKLHLDVLSNGKGYATVVFIPGTSVYAQTYTNFLYALCQAGFNVVAFDPRGHGRSSGRRGDYAINGLVQDTLVVVHYARSRFESKVALVGSSQGGIAAFYAAARDDSLDAVVCHNLADLNGRENQVLSKLRVPVWLTPAAQLLMNIYRRFAFPVALYLDLEKEFMENGRSAASYVRKDPLCVYWITFRALNSLLKTPLAKPVEAIAVPIMVVHAGQDNIFPQAYVKQIYDRLTCPKEFLLLEEREHLVLTNRVEEVAPAIAGWLGATMEKA